MKYICFFTTGHNGDIMLSKSFIKDISEQLDIPVLYHHTNSFKISSDIPVISTQIHPNNNYQKFIETKSIFFINVWLYPYLMDSSEPVLDIGIQSHYYVYHHICKKINQTFNTNIKLKSIENYLPYVDSNFLNTKNIDLYISQNKNKKVLLSNGPCLSGQSPYNGDMSSIIENLSTKHKHVTFIATQKFKTNHSNINFTSDIIKEPGCDLNEIGYLSQYCDLIIGRNSGPFVFSWTNENLNNPNKIFYSFGHEHSKKDCFYKDVDVKCKSIFETFSTEESIYNSIDNLIVKT